MFYSVISILAVIVLFTENADILFKRIDVFRRSARNFGTASRNSTKHGRNATPL